MTLPLLAPTPERSNPNSDYNSYKLVPNMANKDAKNTSLDMHSTKDYNLAERSQDISHIVNADLDPALIIDEPHIR